MNRQNLQPQQQLQINATSPISAVKGKIDEKYVFSLRIMSKHDLACIYSNLCISISECKCDDRGTQKNANYGDWCWTSQKPCKLLTGVVKYWDWVRCHDKGDPTKQELIKCPGANSGETSLDIL